MKDINVLILRTAPLQKIVSLLNKINSDREDYSLYFVCQKSYKKELMSELEKANISVKFFFLVNDGLLNIKDNLKIIKKIRSIKFEKIYVPVNMVNLKVCENIVDFVSLLKSKEYIFQLPSETIIFSKYYFLLRVFKRKITYFIITLLAIVRLIVYYFKALLSKVFIKKNEKCLFYIANSCLAQPLVRSQLITPMIKLQKKLFDYKFVLISFNEENISKTERIKQEKFLNDRNIDSFLFKWYGNFFVHIINSLANILTILPKYDVRWFHCRSLIPTFIGCVVKTIYPFIKVSYACQGMWFEEREHFGFLKKGAINYKGDFNRCLTFNIYKWVFKTADQVFVNTESIKKYLSSKYIFKTDIKVIPCCADVKKYYIENIDRTDILPALKDKVICCYNGTLATYACVEEMIIFFKKFQEKVKNAHFLFVCYLSDIILLNLLKKYKINNEHYTIISVPSEKVAEYLNCADFGLLFRGSHLMDVTAAPTKIAEYLACGLPIVSTNTIKFLKNIIDKYKVGVYLDIGDIDSINNAIEKLMKLIEEKSILKNRCKQKAFELFDWDNYIHLHEKIFRN